MPERRVAHQSRFWSWTGRFEKRRESDEEHIRQEREEGGFR